MQRISLAFVTSAYNESKNLEELYHRLLNSFVLLREEFLAIIDLSFRFVVADNCSQDNSLKVLEGLASNHREVTVLVNRANYGPEASAANALRQAPASDLYVLLCSDLQDPPELAVSMVRSLLESQNLDAVLAVKSRSAGSLLMRLARRSYYKALDYTTRLQPVPNGFHGYGCYRREVIDDALRYWDITDLNLRQCLANASQSAVHIQYTQCSRKHGSSSYRRGGYWLESFRSLISSDAVGSRVALFISICGFILAVLLGALLLANYLSGTSGYGRGIPTVMGLILLSFALQLLIISILSRQIESLRIGGLRSKVRFRELFPGQNQ
jgi:glycosyltransferase involved in cell wall biosynthesis